MKLSIYSIFLYYHLWLPVCKNCIAQLAYHLKPVNFIACYLYSIVPHDNFALNGITLNDTIHFLSIFEIPHETNIYLSSACVCMSSSAPCLVARGSGRVMSAAEMPREEWLTSHTAPTCHGPRSPLPASAHVANGVPGSGRLWVKINK